MEIFKIKYGTKKVNNTPIIRKKRQLKDLYYKTIT